MRNSGIFDARVVLRVKSLAEYRTRHQQALTRMRRLGLEVQEQVVDTPVSARIEHNRWLFDCVCGSGVAVHPDWPEARCMGEGCGRVYTHVTIPTERVAIERTLMERPAPVNRNWHPAESVDDLKHENAEHLRPSAKGER